MKSAQLLVLSSLILVAAPAAPAVSADSAPNWLTRCIREMGANNDAETATYRFETIGKEEGAQGRAVLDYSVRGSPTATIYPTADKDLLNPYSAASLGVAYYGLVDSNAPYATKLNVGRVSLGTIAKDFQPIPGAVKMSLVIDGKTFGPYEPKASSLSSGQYSVWLDTADTDGDGQPPLLQPADFAALAKAIDTMKVAELVLVRDGADIARMPVSPKMLFGQWRDALPKWAAETSATVKAVTNCVGSDKPVN